MPRLPIFSQCTNFRPKWHRLNVFNVKIMVGISNNINKVSLLGMASDGFKNRHGLESFKKIVDCSKLDSQDLIILTFIFCQRRPNSWIQDLANIKQNFVTIANGIIISCFRINIAIPLFVTRQDGSHHMNSVVSLLSNISVSALRMMALPLHDFW